jgi:hypothetical protein
MKHVRREIFDFWRVKSADNTWNSVIYKHYKTSWALSPALAARLASFCVGAQSCFFLLSVLVPFLVPFLEHHPQCPLATTLCDKTVSDTVCFQYYGELVRKTLIGCERAPFFTCISRIIFISSSEGKQTGMKKVKYTFEVLVLLILLLY